MNRYLFEQLIYEEEGPTLDFKKEQYRFAKATEDDKSELLKDILGFANAFRRTEAFIVIGVEDVRGGRGNVVGLRVEDHLDDHSLQQFVHNLTNQPVRFRYEAFEYDGKQVGIISIDLQIRPVYLKRDYGKLAREKVYVRRGSSTDPTKPASPDEIAQMRLGVSQHPAELLVEFADKVRDITLGATASWSTECCEMPEVIPDLPKPRQSGPLWGIDVPMGRRHNPDYFRELANYEFFRRICRPVRLSAKNVGQVVASNVRIEITVPLNRGVAVIEASERPSPPKRESNWEDHIDMRHLKPAFRKNPGELGIVQNDDRYRIEIDCGSLQPGRQVYSEVFYIATEQSGDISLNGIIFADNLPQPKDFHLTASVRVTQKSMTVDELCLLPEPAGEDD